MFSEEDIQPKCIVPYTLQQSGVAREKNESLKEMATCMMHAIYLPPKIWDEALKFSNHIYNRSPHRSVKDWTPFKAWRNNKSKVTYFLIFGSRT
jgi:hypothetical protein